MSLELIPDSELIRILESHGQTVPVRPRRQDLLRRIATPFRKTYSAKEVVELYFTPSSQDGQSLAQVLAPDGNLPEILQMQRALEESDRILLDQPDLDLVYKDGTQQEALELLSELQVEEGRVPQKYLNLTFGQLEELMATDPNNKVKEAFSRSELTVMNPLQETPVAELGRQGVLVSFLPKKLEKSDGIFYLLKEFSWGPGSRRPKYTEGPIEYDREEEEYVIAALRDGVTPRSEWSWNLPNDLRLELEDLAKNPPVEKTRQRRKTSYSVNKYLDLRSQPREVLEALGVYFGTPLHQVKMLDFPSLIFLLTRRELPPGVTWEKVERQTRAILGYLPGNQEFFETYLNSETPVLSLASTRESDPILGYLETLEKDPYTILERLGVVAFPFPGRTPEEVARESLMVSRPQILAELTSGPPNWESTLKNQLWLERMSDLKMLQAAGLQPIYRNRLQLIELLLSKDPQVFYVLDTQKCSNSLTSGDEPRQDLLAYGTLNNFDCWSLEEARQQEWWNPELGALL